MDATEGADAMEEDEEPGTQVWRGFLQASWWPALSMAQSCIAAVPLCFTQVQLLVA